MTSKTSGGIEPSAAGRVEPAVPQPRKGRRGKALLALLLLVPVPTIGAWFGLYSGEMRGTGLGQSVYFASKAWILILPAVWLLLIDRQRPGFSPMKHGGMKAGLGSGALLSTLILLGWFVAGRNLIDPATVRVTASASGIGNPLTYLVFALYLCTINAVLEEYVWRWFVFRKSEDLLGKIGLGAVLLSALFFTVHHVIALLAQFGWLPALLASAGVFAGGCVWSALYLRYRSIWPGFVSHAMVDVVILLLGAWILFGGA